MRLVVITREVGREKCEFIQKKVSLEGGKEWEPDATCCTAKGVLLHFMLAGRICFNAPETGHCKGLQWIMGAFSMYHLDVPNIVKHQPKYQPKITPKQIKL